MSFIEPVFSGRMKSKLSAHAMCACRSTASRAIDAFKGSMTDSWPTESFLDACSLTSKRERREPAGATLLVFDIGRPSDSENNDGTSAAASTVKPRTKFRHVGRGGAIARASAKIVEYHLQLGATRDDDFGVDRVQIEQQPKVVQVAVAEWILVVPFRFQCHTILVAVTSCAGVTCPTLSTTIRVSNPFSARSWMDNSPSRQSFI